MTGKLFASMEKGHLEIASLEILSFYNAATYTRNHIHKLSSRSEFSKFRVRTGVKTVFRE